MENMEEGKYFHRSLVDSSKFFLLNKFTCINMVFIIIFIIIIIIILYGKYVIGCKFEMNIVKNNQNNKNNSITYIIAFSIRNHSYY